MNRSLLVLSIDIGLRNMCFLLLELDKAEPIHLSGTSSSLPLLVNPKAFKIKKTLIRDLKASDQLDVIRGLKAMLDEFLYHQPALDHVVVEKQIGKFGFKQLEYAIFMYFLLQQPLVTVNSIHPSHKLKIHFKPLDSSLLPEETKKGEKYRKNKRDAKDRFADYLDAWNDPLLRQLVGAHKKNYSDIADCLLQSYFVFAGNTKTSKT